MKILTLIENRCERDDLIAEHGLSLYIEKDNKKILLDTGESGKFIENAKTMGININDIDILVLSHGHYDHVGGVEKFLNENSKAKVYLKSAVKEECYAKRLGISKYIGIDKNILKEHFHRLVFVDKLSEIDKDIFIITDIVKEYSLPEGNKYLYIKENGELKKDDFKHELILVIKEKNGLVMFTGCAHSGILNMIKSVKNNFPKEHIKAVLGGFHLMVIPRANLSCMDQKDINYIAENIIKEKIDKVYTGHCTGREGFERLKKVLEDKVEYINTGCCINI